MGTELTVIDPIPLPTAERPALMPSLPAWLQRRSDALESADRAQGYHPRPNLPASLILNGTERLMVEQHMRALDRFLDLNQSIVLRERKMGNAAGHGVLIAGLLLWKGTRLDEAISEQLTEDYLDAIEDLPAWCVREALRKWKRAESVQLDKKPHDFTWRPEPPTLARLARIERSAIQYRIRTMQRLLDANPLAEYSDDHRAKMVAKLTQALPWMNSP